MTVFRESKPETIFVPPTVDEAILRAAHEHLSKREAPTFRWMSLIPWLAATAALVLVGALVFVPWKPSSKQSTASLIRREDVNRDGQVDILDAFALAKELKSGRVSNLQLDLNGDGVVDERDMRMIATEAVKLSKGGRS